MTRKAKRDAARSELIRLLNGLDFYRAWRISGIKTLKGDVRQEDLNEIVEPGTAFLEYFDNAGGQYNQILQFVRQWYAHAYSDLCYMMNTGSEADSSEIHQFLKEFHNEVGFDFRSEAGLIAKIARMALKRGKITKEEDYYILKEFEDDLDQTILNGDEFDAVSDMLRQFENRYTEIRGA